MLFEVHILADAQCEAFTQIEADTQEEAESKAKDVLSALDWDVVQPPKSYDVWDCSAEPTE